MATKATIPLDGLEPENCEIIEATQDSTTLRFPPDSGQVRFAGPVGAVGDASWLAGDYLCFDVYNHQDWTLSIHLLFWEEDNDTDEASMRVRFGILPKLKVRIAFPLQALDSQNIFLPRTPGRLKTVIVGNRIDADRIDRIGLASGPCFGRQTITISNLRLLDREPDYPVPDEILVDELGQYDRRDWPFKTYGEKALVAYLQHEAEKPMPDGFGEGWSRYGGSTDRRYEATGYFYTEHDGGRWWFVDPDGYSFYSVGVDVTQPGDPSYVQGIEKLFKTVPPLESELQPWGIENPMPAHRSTMGPADHYVNYGAVNLVRAFGDAWWDQWARMVKRRQLEWGLNTIGNWSDYDLVRWAGLPYMWPLDDFPSTEQLVFRDFPDVYAGEYARNARQFAEQLSVFQGDPYMIGYFLRNEPKWAFIHDINIAEEVLANPADLASKDALIQDLSDQYGGDIARLNAAWGVSFDSWDGLRAPMRHASRLNQTAEHDLSAFSLKMIERYVGLPSEACRAVDPDHLNLGMRWAYVRNEALLAGHEHFDVFSINCYQMNPSEEITRMGEATGQPILIGEFHFGALDRGMTSTGLRGVTSQAERAWAWRYYVENAAANPHSVGAHYFQYNDQGALGRTDGENYQIGVVDVCNRPYAEFVRGIQETSRTLYNVAKGEKPPLDIPPCDIPNVGGV